MNRKKNCICIRWMGECNQSNWLALFGDYVNSKKEEEEEKVNIVSSLAFLTSFFWKNIFVHIQSKQIFTKSYGMAHWAHRIFFDFFSVSKFFFCWILFIHSFVWFHFTLFRCIFLILLSLLMLEICDNDHYILDGINI